MAADSEDRDRRRGFATDGLVTVRGAFAADAAARMADAIWRHLESHTAVRRADPGTWPREWLAVSFKRLKRHSSFRAVLDAPDVRSTLDDIFGPGGWTPSKSGAQILCTFPNTDADAWRVPHHLWHMDTGFDPRVDPPHAVKLFSVVELLPAHGGATMVIAGSHALQSEYAASRSADQRAGNSQTWGRFLRGADPWLARLIDANDDGVDRNERFARPTQIRGHAVEVRELTGEPGDVHVTHINLFHSASPNAGNRPRVAVTHVVTRSTVDG